MKIDIKIDADLVANVLEEYCTSHECPTGCPFDQCGVCTEDRPFNTVLEKFLAIQKK